MSAYTLAVESVGRSGSVAAVDEGGQVLHHRALGEAPAAAELVPAIQAALAACGRPRALALAIGPGSFTGLRISAVALRTLAWCDDLPLIPVPTLAALACQQGDGRWWTLLPLKKDVTYHAAYAVEGGRWRELLPVAALADDQPPPHGPWTVGCTAVGPALTAKPEAMAQWCGALAQGSAAALDAVAVAQAARCCQAQPWSAVLPAYHRKSAPELQRGR